MKAKEYVNKYKSDLDKLSEDYNSSTDILKDGHLFPKMLKDILEEFSSEIEVLMKSRNSESNQALYGVLTELDNKWLSVSSKIDCLSSNGFRGYIRLITPSIADTLGWK